MAVLQSKIQHRQYEKGEFTNECARDLAETQQLINTFPWDEERALTDVQLTGPSVTIADAYGNYLKVGIYFNGKYCLYYLDVDGHLYEYHTADIQAVNQLVADFFGSSLNVSAFEKQLFTIGSRAHFETRTFEYRVSGWRVFKLTGFLLFYGCCFMVMNYRMIVAQIPWQGVLGIAAISALFYAILFIIYRHAYVNRNNYLQISKGSQVFHFGYTADTVKAYNKADVQQIIIYAGKGYKNANFVELYDIVFKNGDCIRFTNMLITNMDLLTKFSDYMDNPVVPITRGKNGLWKMLWSVGELSKT